jgi:hypothetical protein
VTEAATTRRSNSQVEIDRPLHPLQSQHP